jgi:hypothetical protein
MKEPRRWLDDPATSEGLREVLGAAPAPPNMPEPAHARLSAFAAGLASQALPAEAAAVGAKTAASLSAASVPKVIAIVSLMGALGSGSYLVTRWYAHGSQASRQPDVNAVAESKAAARDGTPPQPIAAPVLTVARAATSPLPADVPSAAARPAPDTASSGDTAARGARLGSAAAFDDLGIADEARLLESARAALGNNPARALELASEHQRGYPSGQLAAEREVIAVDALLRLGRRQEAEERAAPRLRDAPNGLYAKRLRQLLATGSK